MGNTGSSHKITAQDQAILDMKVQRDKLQQYQKKITIITDRETEIAKECLKKGNKDKALLALRRKKYQESLLAKTDQQLAQLEKLTSDVEFALVQKDVVFGLQQGTSVLKAIHKEMGGLERVELIMAESEEARAYQEEISEALRGQMSNQDEDEVEDELAALEREVTGVANDKITLPDAPNMMHEDLPTVPKETAQQKARRLQRQAQATDQTAQPIAA